MRFARDHLTLHQNTLIEQSSGGKDWTEKSNDRYQVSCQFNTCSLYQAKNLSQIIKQLYSVYKIAVFEMVVTLRGQATISYGF